MTALLSVTDLHVSYGKVEAVSGVSLDMQAGQIVTVIGPNGAGQDDAARGAHGSFAVQGREPVRAAGSSAL